MKVRRARQEEGEEIGQLIFDTVRSVNIKDYSPAQVETWVPNPKIYTTFEGIAFVVEKEGKIVGFANLKDPGLLHRLYVHKDHQGEGVGSLLVEAIEKEAVKLGWKKLETEASITAKPFFERKGFHLIDEQTINLRGVNFVNYKMEKSLR